MPSDTRNPSSNQEALLLDQALDAINQRLHSVRQPLAIAHKPQQGRNGLVQAIGRARERGIDFHAEYQRLSNDALDAMGGQPAATAEAPQPVTNSAADPPTQAEARPQAPSPATSAVAPASASAPLPAPDRGLETTRLFLDFLGKREQQLFELMHTVVTRDQPASPAHQQPSQHTQVETQLDRLGSAVADLTRVIDASQPKFPRRVS
jgi:hypothetical protein